MYKERGKRCKPQSDASRCCKGKWWYLVTPSGETHSFPINTTSASVTTLVAATCTTCLCSHTVLNSIKQPCKTATSMLCLCMPPPADTRLVPRAMIISVHRNLMEFHLTSGTFVQTERLRKRLNCSEIYCLWIT